MKLPVSKEVCWRAPQSPKTYTSPPAWESAPEGPTLLMGSREVTESRLRAEQASFFPLGPPTQHTAQHHSTGTWVALPWQIPKSLPLLLVWMNVSSLTAWLLDFHTVWFSGSSGCVLFLNLLLSFFWLCEESQCVYLHLHLG